MIEAAMIWNEPNNKSHWDPEIDPDWVRFAEMTRLAARAIREADPKILRALGGMSPIDPLFVQNLQGKGALDEIDVIAVHGFPLDWNLWPLNDWPKKIDEIRGVTDKPIWVSEVGVSSFGADEVQDWGLTKTAELLSGRVPRIHWYSLCDLPQSWGATTRHKEAEGSSYYRHFYMGLLREDGSPKPSFQTFRGLTPALGLCQWFHFEDPRLNSSVARMKELGVIYLRTGLSWADSFRPGALDWFDRQMEALADFQVTVTFCFTPEHRGVGAHHTSAPLVPEEFAHFCANMISRYGLKTSRAAE
jgi:beta-xylosidase